LEVVKFLKQHPKIESILFPFDESFPQFDLAKKQMKGACGLVTVILKVSKMDEITRFCESLQHIMMAVSWGGHESLAMPKSVGIKPEEFDPANQEHRYVRMYIGLEDSEYLIKDLHQALDKI
jgi:cystathionine beta-lyase/cystathionine gamma-synthase